MFKMILESNSEQETNKIGEKIGQILKGGQVIELVGDVGSGKTTLTKAIAVGLGVKTTVSSPSFTICCNYKCSDNLTLAHYDFYRLSDAGIMADEIRESINRRDVVTVIEWGEIVEDILPSNRITIKISALAEGSRIFDISDNLELVI